MFQKTVQLSAFIWLNASYESFNEIKSFSLCWVIKANLNLISNFRRRFQLFDRLLSFDCDLFSTYMINKLLHG